jgi:hypothetical protein
VIEPVFANKRQGVLTARALINPTQNRTLCRVLNMQDHAFSLKRNSAVAAISPVTDVRAAGEMSTNVLCNAVTVFSKGPDTIKAGLTHEQKLQELRDLEFNMEKDNLTDEQHRQLVSLIYDYRDVFGTDLPGVRDFKYEIKMRPGVEPRRARPIRYNPEMRKVIDQQLAEWEKQGIISEGPYKYAHPLVLVKKQCGCQAK